MNKVMRLFLIISLLAAVPLFPQAKKALVIGNAAYDASPLKNSVNDAGDVTKKLAELGFSVLSGSDLTKRQMTDLLEQFTAGLNAQDVALFYFSGHGVQAQDRNFLIPLKAEIKSENDFEFEALDIGRVTEAISSRNPKASVIILDACRDNPFPAATRSLARGLKVVSAGSSSIVVYSTAPGNVASDGEGRNGLFTEVLLDNLKRNVEINALLTKVRKEVALRSNYQQISYVSSSLMEPIYLGEKTESRIRVALRFKNDSDISNDRLEIINSFFSARLELSDRFDILPVEGSGTIGAGQAAFLVDLEITSQSTGGIVLHASIRDLAKSFTLGTETTTAGDWDAIFPSTTELARRTANTILGITNFTFTPVTTGSSMEIAPMAGFIQLAGNVYPTYGMALGFTGQNGKLSAGFKAILLFSGLDNSTIYSQSTSLADIFPPGSTPKLLLPSAGVSLVYGDKTDGFALEIGAGGFYDFFLGATISATVGVFYRNFYASYTPLVDIKIGQEGVIDPVWAHNFAIGYSIFFGQKGNKSQAMQ